MVPVNLHQRIRVLLSIFMAGLIVSGATPIPLETELKFLAQIAGADSSAEHSGLAVVRAELPRLEEDQERKPSFAVSLLHRPQIFQAQEYQRRKLPTLVPEAVIGAL